MSYIEIIKSISPILTLLPFAIKQISFKKEQEDKLIEYVCDQIDQDQRSNSYRIRLQHYFHKTTGFISDENLIERIVVAANNKYILRRFKYIKGKYYPEASNYKIRESYIENLAMWSSFVWVVYLTSLAMLNYSDYNHLETISYTDNFYNLILSNQFLILSVICIALVIMIYKNQERTGMLYNFALATGSNEYWSNWNYPKNNLLFPFLGFKILGNRIKTISLITIEWIKNKFNGSSNP